MRRLAKALLLLVLLLAVAGTALYLVARRSLPVVDGTLTVPGLSAPIDIVRDADDVPHIFAADKLDALFGLGYVHAQDRLWQMEFQRRIGHGRLSEIFGSATLPRLPLSPCGASSGVLRGKGQHNGRNLAIRREARLRFLSRRG